MVSFRKINTYSLFNSKGNTQYFEHILLNLIWGFYLLHKRFNITPIFEKLKTQKYLFFF